MDEFLKELFGDEVTEETTSEQMQEMFKQKYVSAEEHETALNQEKFRAEKLKQEKDKASAEAAELKRQNRQRLSDEEQEKADREEAERKRTEEVQAMKRELEIGKLTKSYMSMGYDEELATSQATAYYDHDTESLLANEKLFIGAKEKAMRADLLKDMSNPPAGNPKDAGKDDPFLAAWK